MEYCEKLTREKWVKANLDQRLDNFSLIMKESCEWLGEKEKLNLT